MYKLAVFDMDGTLLDTIEDLRAAVNRTLNTLGYPERDSSAFRAFIGSGLYLMLQRALPEKARDDATVKRAIELYTPCYAAHMSDRTTAYSGIPEVVFALCNAGVKIAVLSNKPHDFTVKLAEKFFPGMISAAYGQRDGVPRKPDPTALLMILDELDTAKEDCVYIGDSDVDMLTARNAGVVSVGCTWGYCPRAVIEKAGADIIIGKPSQLLDIVFT